MMSRNAPNGFSTLAVHVVDHFETAETEQGRKLCPGRCSAPAVPFVTANSSQAKKTKKRRRNWEPTAGTIDRETDREGAALARAHTQLLQWNKNIPPYPNAGLSCSFGEPLLCARQACNAQCTHASRTLAEDVAAIKEWTCLVNMAGIAGEDGHLGDRSLNPLNLGALWASHCKTICSGAAGGGNRLERFNRAEENLHHLVEVDDRDLLGRLIELPKSCSLNRGSAANDSKLTSQSPRYAPIKGGLHVRASSGGVRWWQPLGSSFVLGDLLAKGAPALAPLFRHNRYFEIITMDPPWPSKSVNRAKTYSTLPDARSPRESTERKNTHSAMADGIAANNEAREDEANRMPTPPASASAAAEVAALMRLRVGRLADRERGCLVGVWVTNRRSLIDAVQQCFLPSLGALPLHAGKTSSMGLNVSMSVREDDAVGDCRASDSKAVDDDAESLDSSILYWLKVAANGEPVFPLVRSEDAAGCGGRRPFEKMVLGWIPPSTQSAEQAQRSNRSTDDDDGKKRKIAAAAADALAEASTPKPINAPNNLVATHVVASVAPLRHSWKPPLTAILDDILKSCQVRDGIPCKVSAVHCTPFSRSGLPEFSASEDDESRNDIGATGIRSSSTNRLELFARELRPGWTSIGNEAILFQQDTFFEPPTTL